MSSLITNDVKITVVARYRPSYSTPADNQYIFSYEISIENLGKQTIQLLRRQWLITDGVGITREVEGEGVIGKQPILEPQATHTYSSWCPLATPLGHMEGQYLMKNLETDQLFYAQVPRFKLESPVVLN